MKIDRLLGIVMYLLNREIVSASRLAEEFEVSVRTIQRDIDTLTMAGIPIVSYHGSSGGYGIIDNFKLDKQIMNMDDYLYIIKALKSLSSAYENEKISLALEKIKAIMPENDTDNLAKDGARLSLDFSVLQENSRVKEYISEIERAVNEKKVLQFTYTTASHYQSERKVEPLSVIYKWYSWYLFGFCQDYEDYRLFRIARIRELIVSNEKYNREHQDIDEKIEEFFQEDDRNYFQMKILCQAEVRVSVEEYFPLARITDINDKEFILEMSLPEGEQHWLGKILSYGDKVKVLEPEKLQQLILKKVKGIEKLYE